jgi:hypothetical protein
MNTDDDAASDHGRQRASRPAPRSRPVVPSEEPEDWDEEYAAAPVGRSGPVSASSAFQRDVDYETQPVSRRRGAAALPAASSSSAARPRRA